MLLRYFSLDHNRYRKKRKCRYNKKIFLCNMSGVWHYLEKFHSDLFFCIKRNIPFDLFSLMRKDHI